MSRTRLFLLCFLSIVILEFESPIGSTQDYQSDIHVIVNMVQLNVAVTDNKGNYVTGLRPEDFVITEDAIAEKLATFGEGDEPTRLVELPSENGKPGGAQSINSKPGGASPPRAMPDLPSAVPASDLFDTSNYMYRGFVFAQDAIADFIRSLEGTERVAFYSYSRDLSRAASPSPDRTRVVQAVRSTVAGDDAALYNCLLLTVKDAAQYSGRKVIVVFSNGPDNSSVVPPEDVAELAQSTGTVIYMISTREAQIEPYYPHTNPNPGWRAITVRLVGEKKKYHIRTRNGYRPLPARFSAESNLSTQPGSSGEAPGNP